VLEMDAGVGRILDVFVSTEMAACVGVAGSLKLVHSASVECALALHAGREVKPLVCGLELLAGHAAHRCPHVQLHHAARRIALENLS
jgi:hypothetical protein